MSKTYQLPTLPYKENELSDFVSEKTFHYHYGKHHQKYITTLNELLKESELKNQTLSKVLKKSDGKLFNQAAQAWNHTFYWFCLAPKSKRTSIEKIPILDQCIESSFGSKEKFASEFVQAGTSLFGSGWVWVTHKPGEKKLKISQGKDADNPVRNGEIPVLTCDVWEHAYYLDYQNDRKNYLIDYLKVVDWKFVVDQIEKNEPFDADSIMT